MYGLELVFSFRADLRAFSIFLFSSAKEETADEKRIHDFESLGKVVDCVSGTSNLDRHSIQKKYGTQIWSTLNHSKKEQEQERKC